ncbi:histidine kinase [Metasolibacillus meyeri]|uniref:Histidine kinase n=1 Tax=Metasolibacillus meyeri TaxID=1071052 RepID=A0AAW9NXA0_9BACL|nr:histidine kinase [Metasolibacillus meyeri]MEC1180740.1 histidine kinase [Metasolibacillus meyeri]
MLRLDTFNMFIMLCILTPIISAMLLGFISIFEKQIDSLKEEKRRLELEKDLQSVNLMKLNQQIKPHFFFNTLNIILGLARLNRKDDLVRATESLAQFLKFHYKDTDMLVPIEDELALINHYYIIQRYRFGERLQLNLDVSEQAKVENIPPFLLQTLVENAFKHGFEKYSGSAEMYISIKLIDEKMRLVVRNSQHGQYEENIHEESGYGLANIESRLTLLYGKEGYQFYTINENSEFTVFIEIPIMDKLEEGEGEQ